MSNLQLFRNVFFQSGGVFARSLAVFDGKNLALIMRIPKGGPMFRTIVAVVFSIVIIPKANAFPTKAEIIAALSRARPGGGDPGERATPPMDRRAGPRRCP